MIVFIIIAAILLVVGGVAAFGIALARSSKKTQREGAIIPGVDVAVPQSWALSHDAEARLHRRIRDCAIALDATIGNATVEQLGQRAQLLNTARELDERLVAIWSLPASAKTEPLAAAERGVADFEKAATTIALAPGYGLTGQLNVTPPAVAPPTTPLPPIPTVNQQQPAEPRTDREPPRGVAE